MTCKKCGQPMTWADQMASDNVKAGGVTRGLCRDCRRVVFGNLLKKRKEKEEKAN